jgi:DNA-binding CsgD family transcriptional regulator
VRAQALHRESLAIYRELEDRLGTAVALDRLGRLTLSTGDAARALIYLEESLGLKRDLGDAWGVAEVLHDLADVAVELNEMATARSRHEECLLHWQGLGDTLSMSSVFECMAIVAQSQGSSARAIRLASASASLREELHTTCSSPAQRQRLQESLDQAQRAVGPEAAARLEAEGHAMSLDEAVTYARTVDERVGAPSTRAPKPASAELPAHIELTGLTAREREVSALLLRGMSNRLIAEQLVITERTAETHVCRILSKLGLGSRAQIAALVLGQQLPARPSAT